MYVESKLTKHLDSVYEQAKKSEAGGLIVPIIGLTGSGKTAITRSWLEHNKIKKLYIDAITLRFDKVELDCLPLKDFHGEGVTMNAKEFLKYTTPYKKEFVTILPESWIDLIDKDTVVVIDNYDRAAEETRMELFKFITNFHVTDLRLKDNNKIRKIVPLMVVVIIDSGHIICDKVLTKEEFDFLELNFLTEEHESLVKKKQNIV